MRAPLRSLLLSLCVCATLALPGPLPQSAQALALCQAPASAAEVDQDRQAIETAAAGGVPLSAALQCAGFAVLADPRVDGGEVADFEQSTGHAFASLSAMAGGHPNQRTTVFLLLDSRTRGRAFDLLSPSQGTSAEGAGLLPAPAFASGGSVWVDAGNPTHQLHAERMRTAAHELTHVFLYAITQGNPVPAWLNEGLAVYDELTLPATAAPQEVASEAAARRQLVREAQRGAGPHAIFALSQLASAADWDAAYQDLDAQRLEYSEAYCAVAWLVDTYGAASIWQLLRSVGSEPYDAHISYLVPVNASPERERALRDEAIAAKVAADSAKFTSAFQAAFGLSVDALDATLHGVWSDRLTAGGS